MQNVEERGKKQINPSTASEYKNTQMLSFLYLASSGEKRTPRIRKMGLRWSRGSEMKNCFQRSQTKAKRSRVYRYVDRDNAERHFFGERFFSHSLDDATDVPFECHRRRYQQKAEENNF